MPTNTAGLRRAIRRHAVKRLTTAADNFVDTGRSLAPRRTGKGAASITHTEVVDNGSTIMCTVHVGAIWLRYQNEGTGIYGPTGRPITPHSRDGVLVFDWPAAGGIVFTRRVRGVEATHWWDRTRQQWPRIVRSS